MRLDEAIKELDTMSNLRTMTATPGRGAAIKLGVEAMKRVKEGRRKGYDYFEHLLPGETEE